jgi:rhamnosyltransferase subunit B
VPHGYDQPDNAFRIKRMGLGTSVYPERYKAARVAAKLKALLSSGEVRARCEESAKRINSEVAVERACELIEGLGRGVYAELDHATA